MESDICQMNSNVNTGRHFEPGQYIVLYFDLMGVRRSLFSGIDYHSSIVSEEKQNEIDRTSETILGFLNGMQELHDMFTKDPSGLYETFMEGESSAKTPEHKAEFLRQAKSIRMGIQQGSDTTLLYVKDDCEVARMVVSMWMTVLPLHIIAAMKSGVLIRGCFTIGTGWEIRENCLFGPVIHEAAEKEAKEADYPRILVTEAYREMCQETLAKMSVSKPDVDPSINAFRMLKEDSDRKLIFDYLGPVAMKLLKGILTGKGYELKKLEDMLNNAVRFLEYNRRMNRENGRVVKINTQTLAYIHDSLRLHMVDGMVKLS